MHTASAIPAAIALFAFISNSGLPLLIRPRTCTTRRWSNRIGVTSLQPLAATYAEVFAAGENRARPDQARAAIVRRLPRNAATCRFVAATGVAMPLEGSDVGLGIGALVVVYAWMPTFRLCPPVASRGAASESVYRRVRMRVSLTVFATGAPELVTAA
jgi:hypothetical protein